MIHMIYEFGWLIIISYFSSLSPLKLPYLRVLTLPMFQRPPAPPRATPRVHATRRMVGVGEGQADRLDEGPSQLDGKAAPV